MMYNLYFAAKIVERIREKSIPLSTMPLQYPFMGEHAKPSNEKA